MSHQNCLSQCASATGSRSFCRTTTRLHQLLQGLSPTKSGPASRPVLCFLRHHSAVIQTSHSPGRDAEFHALARSRRRPPPTKSGPASRPVLFFHATTALPFKRRTLQAAMQNFMVWLDPVVDRARIVPTAVFFRACWQRSLSLPPCHRPCRAISSGTNSRRYTSGNAATASSACSACTRPRPRQQPAARSRTRSTRRSSRRGNPVKWRWVFTIKPGADGHPGRYKARRVAKGFTQWEGIDYDDT